MDANTSKSKANKISGVIGSSLLLVMALFHGSGFSFVRETILESNSKDFLKEIVPVLFAHPSIHLIGLAAFGILSITIEKKASKKVLLLLSLLILADALLAFYLGGILPGILLSVATLCFVLASRK